MYMSVQEIKSFASIDLDNVQNTNFQAYIWDQVCMSPNMLSKIKAISTRA